MINDQTPYMLIHISDLNYGETNRGKLIQTNL